VRGQQKIFETAVWYDYPLMFVVVGVLSFLGSLVAPAMHFFVIFIAPVAGVIIAERARFVTRGGAAIFSGRRGGSGRLAAGVVERPGWSIFSVSHAGAAGAGSFISLLWPGIYTVMVTSTVYYRLSGIKIG
jgi:hypothetical protein